MPGVTQELGVSGLLQYSGRVSEEWLARLQGERGRRIFREMADNDETIGAILFAIEMLMRGVHWNVQPFSEAPEHKEQAEFVESLQDDMSHTWSDLIAEILTMLVYGFHAAEIVYKRRVGPGETDPTKRSRHTDGRIGWRKLAPRAQETIYLWRFDSDGGITGLSQQPPQGGQLIEIPIDKLLLFRTTSRKNNPEGRSILRNAFVPWWRKKHVAEAEAIGVDRDLAGLPMFYLPPELFRTDATPEQLAQRDEYQRVVENLKADEQAGLLLPALYDEKGNRTVEFSLVSTGARRIFDTNAIIQRYDQKLATVVLADFILLGHEKVGSFALSSNKTDIFAVALGAWLQEIASVLNRYALPRLYELNGWDSAETAAFVPGDLEQVDLSQFAQVVPALTAAGWITPGGEVDEQHVRQVIGLPTRSVDADAEGQAAASGGASDEAGKTKDPTAALNGAQVTAMVGIVTAVATGQLPRDSGIQLIANSFPISLEQAERIMGAAGQGFTPAPPPEQGGGPRGPGRT